MLTDAGGAAIVTPARTKASKTKVDEAMVVLLSSAKGGSAKTTTTRCLASFAAADGLRVAIIDLDEQRTLSKWWQRRSDSLPVIANYNEVPLDEAGVAITEIAASGQHDIIFIDTPPGVERETGSLKAVIRRSDLVLVPTTDGGEDLESVSEWMDVVRREERPAYFLLCKIDRKMPTVGEAKAYLSDKGRICPLDVRQSQAIKRSYFAGQGAADLLGILGQRAAADYKAVWNFAAHSLEMLTLGRALQGLGAAGVMSVNTALVRFTYPRHQLGRGIALISLTVSTSSAAGPTVAAAILSVAPWPYLLPSTCRSGSRRCFWRRGSSPIQRQADTALI